MEGIKKLLSGFLNKEQVKVACEAITNIAGDHQIVYEHINALCKSQDDLSAIKATLADITGQVPVSLKANPVAGKRKYTKKELPAAPKGPPPLPSEKRKETTAEIKGNIASLDDNDIDL